MDNSFNDPREHRAFSNPSGMAMSIDYHGGLGLGKATRSGAIWTLEDRLKILTMIEIGKTPYDVAYQLGRSLYSIFCQLQHLGILDKSVEYNEKRFGSVSGNLPQRTLKQAYARAYELHETSMQYQKQPNQQEKQDMSKVNANHILSLMQENFTTVKVIFPNDTLQYTYKARSESGITVGNFCVVLARGQYKVVEVVAVDLVPDINLDADYEYDWIVQKVDATSYQATQEKEKKFIDTFLAIEKEKKRQEAVADFKKYLPEGTEGNRMLTLAIEELNK